MKASNALFSGLSSQIIDISRLSGIPGVSVGILDDGDVVHEASYGFCDVENEIPCNSESTFALGSLSKAFTSTLLAQLVEEGRLKWNDPLHDILPDFQRNASDLSWHATIADLLTHRTGLSRFDALWEGSDNIPFLNHSDSVDILSYVPQSQPFRGSFIYNNFAYDVLGHVLEKVSGSSYASLLKEKLVRPLGLDRTYYTDAAGQMENEAKPYVALADSSNVQVPLPLKGDKVLNGPAGGVRSSVTDLLVFYNTLMDAAIKQMEVNASPQPTDKTQTSVLPQLSAMWTGWNIFPMPLIREHSYGYGWLRAQLPSVLAPSRGDPKLSPLLGVGAPSRLAVWHSGDLPGYQCHVTLFPETRQAVVVLTNSRSLNAGSGYINDLLTEALLGNIDNAHDYVQLTNTTARLSASRMDGVYKELLEGRTRSEPCQPLQTYVGRYFNAIENFFIDISLQDGDLLLSFMGRKSDMFTLAPYEDDAFFWFLSHDEAARLTRNDGYGPDFYIIRFGGFNGGRDTASTLWWRHEPSLDAPGEAFERHSSDTKGMAQGGSMEL